MLQYLKGAATFLIRRAARDDRELETAGQPVCTFNEHDEAALRRTSSRSNAYRKTCRPALLAQSFERGHAVIVTRHRLSVDTTALECIAASTIGGVVDRGWGASSDIGPILDPPAGIRCKLLILLARPTGIEPVFPP